ncbi:MAG: hypothetical protein ACK5X3_01170, partial [Pseudomonadota bacterium]
VQQVARFYGLLPMRLRHSRSALYSFLCLQGVVVKVHGVDFWCLAGFYACFTIKLHARNLDAQ